MTNEEAVATHMGLQVEDLTQEVLDEQTCDFLAEDASDINNSGREEQIDFIFERFQGAPVGAPTPGPALKKLLQYSWKDIGYNYSGLTQGERDCISGEEFAKWVAWVQT